MIGIVFVRGSSIRKVKIDGKMIHMASQETGFAPVSIDLNKIKENEEDIMKKMGADGLKFIEEVSKLETEEEMAEDIIKDFQRSGWRRVRENRIC